MQTQPCCYAIVPPKIPKLLFCHWHKRFDLYEQFLLNSQGPTATVVIDRAIRHTHQAQDQCPGSSQSRYMEEKNLKESNFGPMLECLGWDLAADCLQWQGCHEESCHMLMPLNRVMKYQWRLWGHNSKLYMSCLSMPGILQ